MLLIYRMLQKPIWIPKDNKSWKDPKSDHFPGSFSNIIYCCSLWDQCTPGVRSKTFREPTIIRVSAWIKNKKYPLYFQAVFLECFWLARSPEEVNYREGLVREGNSWLRYSVCHCSEYSYSICFTTHSWMSVFILCVFDVISLIQL